MNAISAMASRQGSPKEYLLFAAGKEFCFRLISSTQGINNGYDAITLKLERVDSSRNLAQIDLQGFKAKNLRLGINGWHCQPTQHTDSIKTMKSYDTELWTLPGIWKRYIYKGLKQKHLGYVSKPPIHCKAINTCKKQHFK